LPTEIPCPHPAFTCGSGSPLPSLGASFLFWGSPRIKKRQDRGVGGEGKGVRMTSIDLESIIR
jgi:hypothetical protein